jgi:excisionase family DNA binding protein
MSDQEPELLRVSEAAFKLGISKSKCYEMLARNEIPGKVRLSGSIRIRRKDLVNWIDSLGEDVAVPELTSGQMR